MLILNEQLTNIKEVLSSKGNLKTRPTGLLVFSPDNKGLLDVSLSYHDIATELADMLADYLDCYSKTLIQSESVDFRPDIQNYIKTIETQYQTHESSINDQQYSKTIDYQKFEVYIGLGDTPNEFNAPSLFGMNLSAYAFTIEFKTLFSKDYEITISDAFERENSFKLKIESNWLNNKEPTHIWQKNTYFGQK